jgi:ABC-type multidrug transport system fused ATPase/permease subunit
LEFINWCINTKLDSDGAVCVVYYSSYSYHLSLFIVCEEAIMVLALDALWFAILILLLAIFCLAYLMSARVWLALLLVVIVVGLALTIVSTVNKRRRDKTQVASDENRILEYLKSHGIGGNISELAASLGIDEEKALGLLTSMEGQGTIPEGSAKAAAANKPKGSAV